MAIYEYALALNHDATSLTNIEDIIDNAPVGTPIPLGAVKRKTIDRHEQTNGNVIVKWFWAAMSKENFQTLIVLIFGDFTTENADVTIDTRDRDETFKRCNGVAHLPIEGVDYQRRDHGKVEGLTLTIDGIEQFADSGFSTGFDLGFTS